MHKIVGSFYAVLIVISSFVINSCRSEYNEHIDTVAVTIPGVVKKIYVSHDYYQQKILSKTQAFYESNNNKKHWLHDRNPNPKFKAFVAEVKDAARYGMNADDYHIDQLDSAVNVLYKNRKRTDAEMSALDIKITASFFLFTTHLLEGRIRNPGAKDYIWKRGAPHEDDVELLLVNDTKKELRNELDDLQPKDRRYKALRQALEQYRKLDVISFKPIPESLRLKPGDSSKHVAAIRRRLILTDPEPRAAGTDSMLYDKELQQAVARFQTRHGLKANGLVDAELIQYLNIPFRNIADVIALNLERLRWNPHLPTKDEYIIVNVPEYMLRVYRDEKQTFEMKVVLGSEFNATPIFADTLKYIVFSPTWNVPPSIVEEEFLPRLKSNPTHYSADFTFFKNGKEIDPEDEDWKEAEKQLASYQIIQSPGPANSLGHVKFVMPNNYRIYMHDTPADRLFNKQDRAFSHGCIRLEKPLEFAEYLLRDQKELNRKELIALMQRDEPQQVNLKRDYPVHIVYHTAWVDDDGLLNLRKDVYGHDERQLAQLRKRKALLSYETLD
jgi:L,D-transpeptidase YcbB